MILIYTKGFFFFIFDRLKTFPKQLDSKTVRDHSNILHTWNNLNTKNPLNKSKFYLFKPKIADNLLYIKSDRQIYLFINTNFICIQFRHQNKLNPYRQNTYHNFSTIENSFICSKKCVSTILDLMYFFLLFTEIYQDSRAQAWF